MKDKTMKTITIIEGTQLPRKKAFSIIDKF